MVGIPGEFAIFQCETCKQVFLHPQLSKKELVPYYPSTTYYAYRRNAKKSFFEGLREYLVLHYYRPTWLSTLLGILIHDVPAIPRRVRKGKVLDIGCGAGDTLILLGKIGWDVYGMDIDARALDIAKKRGIRNVRQGFIEDVKKYPNGYFDAIRLYHVIEHVDNPELAIKLLYSKLKKGGELVLGTPNSDSFVARIFGTYWYNLDSPRHLFLFTPKTLRGLVIRAKFQVKSIEFCSAGGIAGSLQYWLRSTCGWNIDLIHRLPIVLLFYPIEWIIDKLKAGDVFVLRAERRA